MHPSKATRPMIRFFTYTAIFLSLIACERESYTTWSCKSDNANKIPMILRKAQMEFLGKQFNFCGSLGNQSYFDQKCPAQTDQSSATFTPSSGSLVLNGQKFQCAAL
jgi:hypothetical protein